MSSILGLAGAVTLELVVMALGVRELYLLRRGEKKTSGESSGAGTAAERPAERDRTESDRAERDRSER